MATLAVWRYTDLKTEGVGRENLRGVVGDDCVRRGWPHLGVGRRERVGGRGVWEEIRGWWVRGSIMFNI